MKANVELSLRTREVYQLFQRKINGERLFIESILHKFNLVINQCNQQVPQALMTYKQLEQKMQGLTQQFTDEITNFEILLLKKKIVKNNHIDFVAKYKPTITISNPLMIHLIEFIEVYDMLIAVLKLLDVFGYFETNEIYFGNVKRVQKIANQGLSDLLLAPISSH